jgi:hypothetical protein
MPEIFLGGFLAVAIFAMGMLFSSPAFHPKQSTAEQHSDQKADEGHQAKSLFIPEDATAFFTLWIAAFTGVLAISTILLWRSTRDAAIAGRIAAEHIPTVERAWLFAGPDGKRVINREALMQFPLLITNYGKTPGFLRTIWAECGNPDVFNPTPKYAGGAIQLDVILGAGEPHTHTKLFSATTEQFFYGYIRYADIFGNFQVSRFCVRLARDKGEFQLAGHPNWNIHYTEKKS